MKKLDTCGIPSRADWYVFIIWSLPVPGGTETGYTDAYMCDDHMPGDLKEAVATWTRDELTAYPYIREAADSLLRWDGHERAEIAELKVSHLRTTTTEVAP